jgi:hypothetical protein
VCGGGGGGVVRHAPRGRDVVGFICRCRRMGARREKLAPRQKSFVIYWSARAAFFLSLSHSDKFGAHTKKKGGFDAQVQIIHALCQKSPPRGLIIRPCWRGGGAAVPAGVVTTHVSPLFATTVKRAREKLMGQHSVLELFLTTQERRMLYTRGINFTTRIE